MEGGEVQRGYQAVGGGAVRQGYGQGGERSTDEASARLGFSVAVGNWGRRGRGKKGEPLYA
jgi:hypothetical protein